MSDETHTHTLEIIIRTEPQALKKPRVSHTHTHMAVILRSSDRRVASKKEKEGANALFYAMIMTINNS